VQVLAPPEDTHFLEDAGMGRALTHPEKKQETKPKHLNNADLCNKIWHSVGPYMNPRMNNDDIAEKFASAYKYAANTPAQVRIATAYYRLKEWDIDTLEPIGKWPPYLRTA
jgi:hypothetical protein